MKRQKIKYTWEILDKLLNLQGMKIYNTKIVDDGLLIDIYGGDTEHDEGSCNMCNEINTINQVKDIEFKEACHQLAKLVYKKKGFTDEVITETSIITDTIAFINNHMSQAKNRIK